MTDELVKGLAEFKRYQYAEDSSLMNVLAKEGQSPRYFIISCIDSRTNPGTIFRARPGTFFAHKAMGAIVRPYKTGTALAAALQFALNYNKVDTIIVLGHTQCGAVKALAENIDDEEIASFISVVKHAHDDAEKCCSAGEDINAETEKRVVLESVENLKKYPSVAKALEEKRVTIKPWIFDIAAGDLLEHSEQSQSFETITTDLTPEEDSRQDA
ncbi:MAG: carbonic anhydrase [Alphaproteobacteria bacterium]